jgi:hypothetical protein
MVDSQSNAAMPAFSGTFEIPADAPRSGVIRVRARPRDRFTIVGNHLAQHPDLSAVAIGIAVYIQSLPDGADVTVKRLTLRFREGEITIRRAVNELVEQGYLERRRVPLGRGRFATRVLSYDDPACRRPEPPWRSEPPTGPVPPQSQPQPPREQEPPSAPFPPPAAPAPPPWSAQPTPPPPPPAATATPPQPPPPPPPPLSGPAADLLSRLRTADPRLLLSLRDIHQLAPAVDTWLERHATAEQITRTLTAGLPPVHVPIHSPARLLAYRLATHLPPPLPESPQPAAAPPPFRNCEVCERAIRTRDPHPTCADCRAEGHDQEAA